jgi:hypothetical protein
MAGLYDTLFQNPDITLGIEEKKMDIHNFYSAIVDYVSGNTTRNQIINFYPLSGEQITELDILLASVDALSTIQEKLSWLMQFQAVMLLSWQDIKYDDRASFVARLELL